MAPEPVLRLLLWGLLMAAVPGEASWCNLTCSTDYIQSINCSCSSASSSGWSRSDSILVHVTCWGEDLIVNGSCDITPPRSWCSMILQELDYVASIGTSCTSDAVQQDGEASETSSWQLADMVKLSTPANVRVVNNEVSWQVTWDIDGTHKDDCLTYRVRIREKSGSLGETAHSVLVSEQCLLLDYWALRLQPGVEYVVDVQARRGSKNLYQGPWSEWSPPAAWRLAGSPTEAEGISATWWFFSLPVLFILGLLLLGYLHKPCWQKKLRLVTFVPNPDKFFQPLYRNHQGDFREWVKPVFREYDYFQVGPKVPTSSEKPDHVVRWSVEKRRYSEDGESKRGLRFLGIDFPEDTDRSPGHLSILTVTLSGDDREDQGSLRDHQDGESLGSCEEEHQELAGLGPGLGPDLGLGLDESQMAAFGGQSGASASHCNRISWRPSEEPHAQVIEPERVSLDSFASNGPSEDGYPRVDLDTIDSGFGECSSPVSGRTEPTESEFEQNHSNYVKQWMISGTAQEGTDNPAGTETSEPNNF